MRNSQNKFCLNGAKVYWGEWGRSRLGWFSGPNSLLRGSWEPLDHFPWRSNTIRLTFWKDVAVTGWRTGQSKGDSLGGCCRGTQGTVMRT